MITFIFAKIPRGKYVFIILIFMYTYMESFFFFFEHQHVYGILFKFFLTKNELGSTSVFFFPLTQSSI